MHMYCFCPISGLLLYPFVNCNRLTVVSIYCMQDDVRKEAQTMSLIDHPNVIRSYCSFVVDHNLWVVMPFMSEGSCLHLMKIAYPDGFDEPVIASILKETLKALEYLHRQGHIHRDVKVGFSTAGFVEDCFVSAFAQHTIVAGR